MAFSTTTVWDPYATLVPTLGMHPQGRFRRVHPGLCLCLSESPCYGPCPIKEQTGPFRAQVALQRVVLRTHFKCLPKGAVGEFTSKNRALRGAFQKAAWDGPPRGLFWAHASGALLGSVGGEHFLREDHLPTARGAVRSHRKGRTESEGLVSARARKRPCKVVCKEPCAAAYRGSGKEASQATVALQGPVPPDFKMTRERMASSLAPTSPYPEGKVPRHGLVTQDSGQGSATRTLDEGPRHGPRNEVPVRQTSLRQGPRDDAAHTARARMGRIPSRGGSASLARSDAAAERLVHRDIP
ncbi:hypothetical protein M885DRAFT_171699 [Pelagophyceae sp. CCMP2097]|nr:hypothetical protein M885DRAFT_171699 [Pelagophyceae sp. CCMP2097]|mmetsp:Transcript_17897/g.61741  ORF Transcript_17897/g.61741 Transcript_17897/m.61741 type:complete len:298 (+) Transcript_17897:466-1359(+)